MRSFTIFKHFSWKEKELKNVFFLANYQKRVKNVIVGCCSLKVLKIQLEFHQKIGESKHCLPTEYPTIHSSALKEKVFLKTLIN